MTENPGPPEPAQLLALAEAAAAQAALMLADRRSAGRPGVIATKSSPTDVVTEADRTAESMITKRILAERPGDVILGEEGGLQAGYNWQAAPRWVLGIQADASYLDSNGNYTCMQASGAIVGSNCAVSPRVLASLTGRAGFLRGDSEADSVEEVGHARRRGLAAQRGQDVERVLGQGELGVGHGLRRDGAEPLDEDAGHVDGDEGVVGALQHVEGRRVRVDPVDR